MADVSGWLIGAVYWAAAVLGVVPAVAVRAGWAAPEPVRDSFTLGAAVALAPAAAFAWVRLLRAVFEMGIVPAMGVMYRVRGTGPGLTDLPPTGPVLVIANHACWFDPLFLGSLLPRPITPMMTSVFYDLPGLRWLMVNVFHTIRVEEKALKQDVPPEIGAAVAALDRGECVVLFPEGYLRRSDGKPLKRFGRGVWHILTQRPDTPVVTCWIEGAWGSYTSYAGGTPTKGKKPDWRRPIGVGVPGPVTIAPAELAHHLRTRLALMNRVAASRALLGLPDLPAYERPEKDEGGAEN
jgi:1-acyl-sn-glycerol-3-phosphate acyltransferase